MKKYLNAIISAVLILSALVSALLSDGKPLGVGKSLGISAKIETLEDVHDVLDFISRRTGKDTGSGTRGVIASAALESSAPVSEKYESATIICDLYQTIIQKDQNGSKITTTLDGDCEIYIAQDRALYIYDTKFEYYSNTSLSSMDVYMKVSIFTSDDQCLIKIDSFETLSDSEYVSLPVQIMSKWLDITAISSIASLFGEALSLDQYAFREIGDCIEKACEENVVKKYFADDDIYTIDVSRLAQTFTVTEIKVDLSKKKSPFIEWIFDSEDEKQDAYATYLIKNIDTTKVPKKINPDLSFEDLEYLFNQ